VCNQWITEGPHVHQKNLGLALRRFKVLIIVVFFVGTIRLDCWTGLVRVDV